MKARVFGFAAILGALGAGFCCLGPLIFSAVGVSALVSLTVLRWVVPYRNAFFGVTLAALGLAIWSVIVRRGRVSPTEWAVLGGSMVIIAALFVYTISVEGAPRLW